MSKKKRIIIVVVLVVLILIIVGCVVLLRQSKKVSKNIVTYDLDFENSKWSYDSDNDIYYQIGVNYVEKIEAEDYESLGIYVPGKYLDCTKEDSYYKCTVNAKNKVGNYTSKTAPIVMPINTAGYSAQKAPTSYSANGITDYIKEGFIYVYSGARGRYESEELPYNAGAPWGVVDFKAAIRYLRYNSDVLPGNADNIFTFGHSGGGAQSVLLGVTGDAKEYTPYLESIGAAMTDKKGNEISDKVKGVMGWCPITNLDVADLAYEWNMGQFMTTGTRASGTFTKELSNDLAEEYAKYINKLKLTDKKGNKLTLSKSSDGIYLKGTYYDYLVNVLETSLNNFINDTTFPYTQSNNQMADGGFGGSNDSMPSGETPSGEKPSGDMPSGDAPSGEKPSGDAPTGNMPSNNSNSSSSSSTTYNSIEDYISYLNTDSTWVKYDSSSKKAIVLSLEGFVKSQKSATKDVGAFDSLDLSQAENKLFGNKNTTSNHFDTYMANILSNNKSTYSTLTNWDSSYADSYKNGLSSKDSLGKTVEYRSNMYNPMYYLNKYYKGYGASNVSEYFRINTGITQGDTASVTEMNLALALQSNKNVKDISFTTVWAQGHTSAERTGNSTTNFISWINDILK